MPTYTFIDSQRYLDRARQPIELVNAGEKTFKSDLQAITEGVQAERTDGLLRLQELQFAAQLLLAAESRRIAGRDPADGRVAALVQGAEQASRRAEIVEQEAAYSTIRVPLVRKTQALLHGRITDEFDRNAGAVTVRLLAGGEPVDGVGAVEVDSAGYYALVIPPDAAARLGPDTTLALRLEHADETVVSEVPPVTLAASQVQVQDVRLGAEQLERLKLVPPKAPNPGRARPRRG